MSSFYLGFPNGDKPINYIINSIYNISINQYYLYTLAFSYLGTLIFTMFIVLLSIITKNVIVEFGLPILLYFIPSMFKLPDFIRCINFSELFSGKTILINFDALNIFGNVVLYPYVITFTGAIALIIMLLLYRKLGKTQTIV